MIKIKNIKYLLLSLSLLISNIASAVIVYDNVSFTSTTNTYCYWTRSENGNEASPVTVSPTTSTLVSTNGDFGFVIMNIAPILATTNTVVPILTVTRDLFVDYSAYNLPNLVTNWSASLCAPSNTISVYAIVMMNGGLNITADFTVIGDPSSAFYPSPSSVNNGIFHPQPTPFNPFENTNDNRVVFPIWAMPNVTFLVSTSSTLNNFVYSESLYTDTIGYGVSTQYCSDSLFRLLICTNNGVSGGLFSTNLFGGYKCVWPTGKTAFSFPFARGNNQTISNLLAYFPTNIAIISTINGNNSFSTNWHTATGWTEPTAEILSGNGYFLLNTNAAFTNLIYGSLKVGTLNRSWSTANGTYIFVSPTLPKAGYIQDLGFNNDSSDSVAVALWNGTAWESSSWDENDGWSSLPSFSVDAVKGPFIKIGQPLRIERHGSDSPSWSESFIP